MGKKNDERSLEIMSMTENVPNIANPSAMTFDENPDWEEIESENDLCYPITHGPEATEIDLYLAQVFERIALRV